MSKNAIIIGGGIGGLAAAIGLRRAGFAVEIFERSPELKEVGSGISLWRNALVALDRLGVLDVAKSRGVAGQKGGFRTPDGKMLLEMKAGAHGDTTAEGIILLLHRAELLSLLLDAVGRDTVTVGTRCVGIDQTERGVTARFENGREVSGDLLIGADGLRSVVRESLFGPAKPNYAGYTTWRAIVPFDISRLSPGETWGRGKRFGQWGMANDRAYWYATQTASEGQGDPPHGRKQGLLDLFRCWHPPVEDLIEATDESAILHNDVYDRPALSRWSVGHASLLGDAAHPMTPDMGQGACQAIEDAVILADCLQANSDIPQALRDYEVRRIPRTSRVVRESRRAAWIAQWSNPLACRFRAALLRSHYVAREQAKQMAWMITPQV
ncbi:FAD-dependent monooxygenase [Singulisphaera sp. Ch08]|uniref:FAD-dependent monooxygenase n=1 Tax=Singulisphaera sp. Ch08 TaxID=3120278 RepID=A0AAU7CLD5_9BACT